MSKEFGEEAAKLERECYELAGQEVNPNSPIQLRDVLFNHLKLTVKGLKKTKSGYSTESTRWRSWRRCIRCRAS